jgi:primosomal protein N' (replication factor Y)
MKQEVRIRRSVSLISTRLEHLLKTTIQRGEQAILLLNRRGYSSFVYCPSCQEAVECKYCDATLTYHRNPDAGVIGAAHRTAIHTGQLHCHYCLAVNPLPSKCPTCGKLLSLFGLGTQRVEEELRRRLPEVSYARVDSDSMRSSADYEELLKRFGRGEVQVLLGTQMIAKGLDFPNVTLVGVISGDTALSLPDFRAAERTFQLITQVAGRAGRGDKPGRVIVQTYMPDDATIQAALRQDFEKFAKTELDQRRDVGLPPFGRLARIILRDESEEKLQLVAARLADDLTALLPQVPEVRIKGPMPCAINRIAGYHRVNIQFSAPTAKPIQDLLALAREEGLLKNLDRLAIDIDPLSLL